MDSKEKITLMAEIGALTAQMLTPEDIAKLSTTSTKEYNNLLNDIGQKYNAELANAQTTKDKAVRAAEDAKAKALADFNAKVADLNSKKATLEEQAKTYYSQLCERDNAVQQKQAQLAKVYAAKKARLDEVLAEEAKQKAEEEARKRAEEEARRKAEEAKRLAEEEAARKAEEEAKAAAAEAARKAAEEEARKTASRRPLIKF